MSYRLMAVPAALLAMTVSVSAQQHKQLALNNVSGAVGVTLAGKTCTGAWEVDNKVPNGAMDFAAFQVKFSAKAGVLGGEWYVALGKAAHDAPGKVFKYEYQGELKEVQVNGASLSFKTPRGVPWQFTVVSTGNTVVLDNGSFDPRTYRADWSPGKAKATACK